MARDKRRITTNASSQHSLGACAETCVMRTRSKYKTTKMAAAGWLRALTLLCLAAALVTAASLRTRRHTIPDAKKGAAPAKADWAYPWGQEEGDGEIPSSVLLPAPFVANSMQHVYGWQPKAHPRRAKGQKLPGGFE
jgi:hypothetical protein